MPSRLSIPQPFNENDVTIWSDLICKFVCRRKKMPFDLASFLDDIVNDRIMPLNAYNREMLNDAAQGEKNVFYRLVLYCLNYLQSNRLLSSNYLPTERLKSICPQINQVLMPGITSLLRAEREIRENRNYQNIIRLLTLLDERKKFSKNVAIKFVSDTVISKLIQTGIVILYLDENIMITPLGRLVLPLLTR